MSTDSQTIELLSDGVASETAGYHLAETNDSAIIDISGRDRRFLAQVASRNQLDVEFLAEGRARVASTGYAGVVALPDGHPIHVQPKITGTALLRLLQYSGATNVETLEQEAAIEAGTDYVDLLGQLFIDELEHVRRRGISQSYQTTSQTEDYIRGRLNMQRQLQQRGPAAPDFECTYDELTRDTTLNQTILFATHTLVGAVSEPALQQRLRRHVQELRRSVTLQPITHEEADGIHLTRLDDHYSDLLRLAKLVLRNVFIQDVAPGQAAGYTILLLMYEQFEAAVENAVTAAAPEYTVKTGSTAKLRGFLEGEFSITPEPDVIIEDTNGEAVVVLDAKWKDLEKSSGAWSPSREDIYQMLSYQQHTHTPGILVYPGDSSGVLGKAETTNGQQLWLASLPVNVEGESLGAYADYQATLDTALTTVIERAIGTQ
jgi:5-methylcytosine-specific restriction enzyme subunit McrC